MPDPTVCAVMLTCDRPELARRAVECFRAQTYPAKRLLILDSGVNQLGLDSVETMRGEFYVRGERGPILPTIGNLRNMANGLNYFDEPDILIHWDDDDWSHPSRIAEQVGLLESSGAACVGYSEMLFWRGDMVPGPQAWLFNGPTPLGTSLCYRRKAWEAHPFAATSYGEDTRWLRALRGAGLKIEAVSSTTFERPLLSQPGALPQMIARIHAGNTSAAYSPRAMREAPQHWKRTPEWDAYCRGVME